MEIIKITRENIDNYKAIWDSFVKRHEKSTFQHSVAHLKSREVTGEKIESFLILENNRIRALFPLLKERKMVFSRYKTAGILLDGLQLDDALKLVKKHFSGNASHIEIQGSSCANQGSQEFSYAHDYILDMKNKGEETIWKSLVDRKSRNLVRKAEKEGLKAKVSRESTELSKFYKLYADRMKRFGNKPYPPKYFNALFQLHKDTFLMNVYSGKELVSGAVLVVFKEQLLNPYAASSYQHLKLSPNNFMYWEMIKFGLKKKCTSVNYGPSLKKDNVSKFKSHMGGVPALAESHIVLSKTLYALFKGAKKRMLKKKNLI